MSVPEKVPGYDELLAGADAPPGAAWKVFGDGELRALDELAADCADDRIYEFLLVCKPLNIIGGVGSPPNATAVK